MATYLIVFGVASLLGLSQLSQQLNPMLTSAGLGWMASVSPWLYVALGAILLAIALAMRVAHHTTSRVVFGILRMERDNITRFICYLPISQFEHIPSRCRVRALLKKIDGTLIRDISLRTVGRLRSPDPNCVDRINIDDAPKDFRLFTYDPLDGEFCFDDSVIASDNGDPNGTLRLVRDSYKMEIIVAGAGPVAERLITITALPDSIYASDGINGHGQEIIDGGYRQVL